MKVTALVFIILFGSCPLAFAQSSIGGRSNGAAVVSGNSTGWTGSALSNGSTVSGTGGGPGANTSNALNHGTTGTTWAPQIPPRQQRRVRHRRGMLSTHRQQIRLKKSLAILTPVS